MKYYYMVDDVIGGEFMGWFKNEEEFFESLEYQFSELEDNEDFDEKDQQAIIKSFKTKNDWEECVNSFVYGVSSDKESVYDAYCVREEDKNKIID